MPGVGVWPGSSFLWIPKTLQKPVCLVSLVSKVFGFSVSIALVTLSNCVNQDVTASARLTRIFRQVLAVGGRLRIVSDIGVVHTWC